MGGKVAVCFRFPNGYEQEQYETLNIIFNFRKLSFKELKGSYRFAQGDKEEIFISVGYDL